MHLLFNYNIYNSEAGILAKNPIVDFKCEICGKEKWQLNYDEVTLDMRNVTKLDLLYGGSGHHIMHESVAETLLDNEITGCEFHPVQILVEEAHLENSIYPNYYSLEPIGRIETSLPMDEGIICPHCGIFERKIFGGASKPLLFDWSTWDGADVVGVEHLPGLILVNRKVIELFRKKGWHHNVKKGRWNKKYDAVQFGDYVSPGIGVRNIDRDTWYEDTLAALREKYPEREW